MRDPCLTMMTTLSSRYTNGWVQPCLRHKIPRTRCSSVPIRDFSHTSLRRLRTSELFSSSTYKSLRCNPGRLWHDIHSTAEFGKGRRYGTEPEQTGLSRLALSDSDKQARDWFVETTNHLGCEVTIDSVGNIFAIRKGLRNDVPATFVGSHLDSQPLGGRFDGVLGVMAGIEMLRVLDENWIETEAPVGVVNWTNEEGARFPVSVMGSGEWAGRAGERVTDDVVEIEGSQRTVKQELERIGYRGQRPASVAAGGVPMAGHFELHIEQGPRLEAARRKVGVVTGSQAYKWLEIACTGKACHAGTTPMNKRTDPMWLAATMIKGCRQHAESYGGLITVGNIRAEPGSVNTVPDRVVFTLDARTETDEGLAAMLFDLFNNRGTNPTKFVNEHLKAGGNSEFHIEVKELFHSKATHFDDIAISCVEDSAKDIVGGPMAERKVMRLVSGAGHDSVNTSKVCPTAMVFVPCKDGVSHHPEEWCDKNDCALGTDVIIQSILRFDRHRYYESGPFSR